MSSDATPIAIVRTDGTVEALGSWSSSRRTLELERAGFPFFGPGTHVLEGELPWIFWDMAPSGYIGARFARAFPELALPDRTQDWGGSHVLAAISRRGEDLSGNLIVGRESRERYERELAPAIRSGARKKDDYAAVIEEFLAPGSFGKDSSLGGERPKVVLHSVGQAKREMLLKFTPPLSTELGTRWSNLLAFEALCAQTLASHGIPASGASPATFQRIPGSDRAGILLPRFDRPTELGRAGAATLYHLAAERGEFELSAPKVMASLARDGLVSDADAETVALVHSFSAAIGNTDAHLGNYALLFDDAGTASLAPIYDVTAMIFAPRADELPDSRVTPRTHAVAPLVRPLFDTLLSLVDASPHLDTAFKALWLRYVGA